MINFYGDFLLFFGNILHKGFYIRSDFLSITKKEIFRIPELLNETKNYKINYDFEKRYVFVGCGSSYNLGLITSRFLLGKGIQSTVLSAGSVISTDISNILDKSNDVLIFISRTGESSETVLAEKLLKESGFYCLGITCQKDSSIIKNSDESFLFDYAYEESVVMTGSFVVILNFLLGQFQNFNLHEESERIIKESDEITDEIDLEKYDHFVFLGFNELFGLAKEGSLKLQEMALESVEYYEPLEYRHGPKSTLDDSTIVLFQSKGTKYELDLIEELKSYNARVIVVGPHGDIDINNEDKEIPLRTIPFLLLGYKKSISKGLNPDSPKNLSKTVII